MLGIFDLLPWAQTCKAMYLGAKVAFFRHAIFDFTYHIHNHKDYQECRAGFVEALIYKSTSRTQNCLPRAVFQKVQRVQCSIQGAVQFFPGPFDYHTQTVIPTHLLSSSIRELTVVHAAAFFRSLVESDGRQAAKGEKYRDSFNEGYNHKLRKILGWALQLRIPKFIVTAHDKQFQHLRLCFYAKATAPRVDVEGINLKDHDRARQRLIAVLNLKADFDIRFVPTNHDRQLGRMPAILASPDHRMRMWEDAREKEHLELIKDLVTDVEEQTRAVRHRRREEQRRMYVRRLNNEPDVRIIIGRQMKKWKATAVSYEDYLKDAKPFRLWYAISAFND